MENRDMVSIDLLEYERLIKESSKLRTLLNYFEKKSKLTFDGERIEFYQVELDKTLELLFPFEYYKWIQAKRSERESKEEVEEKLS